MIDFDGLTPEEKLILLDTMKREIELERDKPKDINAQIREQLHQIQQNDLENVKYIFRNKKRRGK